MIAAGSFVGASLDDGAIRVCSDLSILRKSAQRIGVCVLRLGDV